MTANLAMKQEGVGERLIEARTSGAAIARRAGWIDRQGRQCWLRLEAGYDWRLTLL